MNRMSSFRQSTWILAFAVCLALLGTVFAQQSEDSANATQAFARLKALVGHWEATTDQGKVSTSYELVSGGTALLERLNFAGMETMITVYHLDGDRLLLTHYCHSGNQPRMQARAFDPKSNEVDFDFVDATNLTSQTAGHVMRQVTIKFNSANEVAANWTGYENGKPGFTVPLLYHRLGER